MLGVEAEKVIINIPLSDSIISKMIIIMYNYICQVTEVIQNRELFELQINEWKDISNKAQLIEFIVNKKMINLFVL